MSGIKHWVMAAILLMAASGVCAAEGMPTDYAATTVMTSADGVRETRQFVSGKKARIESDGSVMIVRQDLNLMWIVMASENMYMEHPLDTRMARQTDLGGDSSTREKIGDEEVNGQPAEKYLVTDPNGQAVHQWIGRDGRPLRMQAVDQSWTVDFKDFQAGAQDPAIFEEPTGYQKMAMPNMGDMMAQAMAGNE